MRQIPLPLSLPNNASFGNYLAGENHSLLGFLQQFLQSSQPANVLIYGMPGVGLSHLLQASCQLLHAQGQAVAYLPLANPQIRPEMLDGLEHLALICIDDLHLKINDGLWAEALFHCYNRVQQLGTKLLMASHLPPSQWHCSLADLQSRLMSSMIFMVKPLTDQEKITALQQNAKQRGMLLTAEAAAYLLYRFPRDLPALFKVLDKLDEETLIAQRRLTIPFIKSVVG